MKASLRLLLAVLLVAFGFGAAAQDYPSRTVTIIVPYPAGGPTDQLARVLAPKFSEKLGQNFIVENISGGGTTIATGRVARGTKDGHTLLLHNHDRPGVVGAVGTILGEAGCNISRMQLALQRERGEAAMLVNLDNAPGDEVLERLRTLPHVISCQHVEL